ncbi:unnamed protein product [Blepharisma stoltei]|uniref:Uncharacterized protein n=1 Tax=Blepharisma stoltei TaxID=1481888 RepID=A0AAU9INN0_9CILI|nr:unnamed protein product [Blepharisma stoltei]
MDFDPLKLKRFGDKNYKTLMGLAAAAVGFLALAIVFLIISSVSGSAQGSANREISNWNKQSYAEALHNITLKLKVIPSQGHGVVEFMNWTNTEEESYQKEIGKSITKYDVSYHEYTADTSLKFSTLAFNEDVVPVGDAQSKCVYVEWAPSFDKNKIVAFKPLENMPNCSHAGKGGMWNDNDPKVGIDVSNWWQNEIELSCSGKGCQETCKKKNGVWVWKNDEGSGVCFTYDILESICLKMKNNVDIFGKSHWAYAGGCYQDNQPGKYETGKPGETYHFASVDIEVRGENDPYIALLDSSGNEAKISHSSGIASSLAWIMLVGFIGSVGAFGFLFFKLKKEEAPYAESA